jgi:predicted kinase
VRQAGTREARTCNVSRFAWRLMGLIRFDQEPRPMRGLPSTPLGLICSGNRPCYGQWRMAALCWSLLVRIPNAKPEDWAKLTKPFLYVFAGLPGTGKTTLSQLLASKVGAAHLRIDTIEQALRDLCSVNVEGEGYRLAYRVAGDILRSRVGVVADSCNPVEVTRREWEQVAKAAGAQAVNIEVVCSDPCEHRLRVEQRTATVPGLRLPTWEEVETREYHAWTTGR